MKLYYTGSLFAAILSASILRYAADKGGTTATEPEAEPEPYDPFVDHPIIETVDIEIKKLTLDAGTQPRVSIDDEVVKEYTEVIKKALKDEEPIPFPAIDAFRDPTGRIFVADGFQRILAHKAAHVKEITTNIRAGTELDALVFSLSANSTHGLPRTNKDKQRAVKMALARPELQDLANTEIAKICNVSEGTVRNVRDALKSPTTRKVTIQIGRAHV